MGSSSVDLNIAIANTETLDESELPGGETVEGRQINVRTETRAETLDGTTTPDIYKSPVTIEATIDGTGTFDIDLTAAAVGVGRTQDFTGKKLVIAHVGADKANAGNVLVAPGSSNGYPVFGSSSGQVSHPPGESSWKSISGVASSHQAVDATHKIITVTGTTNDVVKVQLWFGS